ncbi:MAG: hypothetical protein KDD62_16225 [Bdellovibrionales bacterium]|nr:hypothetical protein [Bdellovibrionales bacterium]
MEKKADESQLWRRIHYLRTILGLNEAHEAVRAWWLSFETCNQDYPDELLKVLELVDCYAANLNELWLCYTFSMDQEVQCVLDYLVMKKKNLKENRELTVNDFVDTIGIPLLLH